MDSSRSAEVPEVGDKGWPALIKNLRVTDKQGRTLEVVPAGEEGWKLKTPYKGTLSVAYEVDYSGPQASNWPAPRETAFADANHFLFVGRSAFITTPKHERTDVRFSLPAGWHAVAPWRDSPGGFTADSVRDLVENLIVLSKAPTETVSAGGFTVAITLMGHWQNVRKDVLKVLHGVIPQYVRMMGYRPNDKYSVVLLPVIDEGGEAYRASFAFNVTEPPTAAARGSWGHTIAHEIFHYWNGYRLRGADYASSQWFQEGFTDYTADVVMVGSGLIGERDARGQIDRQIARYRKLATPLAKPGTHKGPPLYGGGALVALSWDIQIRNATGGRRGLADLWKAMWRQTRQGKDPYAWPVVRSSLNEVAGLDWDEFYRKYVDGTDKLPLDEMLGLAGLRLVRAADGSEHVETDDLASKKAASIGRSLGLRK